MTYEEYCYRGHLESLCCYSRDLRRYAVALAKGEDLNLWRLNFAAGMKKRETVEVLKLKRTLGLPGGVDFLTEENNFLDFDIKGGRLIGGTEHDVYSVTQKWIDEFPEDYNPHNFEVAIYARVLANPDYISDVELYPAEIRAADDAPTREVVAA